MAHVERFYAFLSNILATIRPCPNHEPPWRRRSSPRAINDVCIRAKRDAVAAENSIRTKDQRPQPIEST